MNIFGVGLPEMAVIGAVALLVFGPKRLPELGRTLGKTLKGFQSASKEFEREINIRVRNTPAPVTTSASWRLSFWVSALGSVFVSKPSCTVLQPIQGLVSSGCAC